MGAKLSKSLPNPCSCWPKRRRKSKVVPIGLRSFGVAAENNAALDPTYSLAAVLRPADPAVRLGWRSDLVLEDVDIEVETCGMALPARALPLPPVIPPPSMRIPSLEATSTEEKLFAQADIPGFIQSTNIDESEVYFDYRTNSDCCIVI